MKKVALLCLAALGFIAQANAEVAIRSTKPVQSKNVATPALNLSEDKKQQIEKITNSYNSQLTELKPRIKEKSKSLKTELAKDNPDLNTLEAINKEIFTLKEEEQFIRLKYQVELSKVLTADQRKTLNKLAKANAAGTVKKSN